MERVLKTFHQFDESDQADWEYYASLSPEERLDMLLEIIAQGVESFGEAAKGLERVYCVTELSQD